MTDSRKKTDHKADIISFGSLGLVTITESKVPSDLEVYAKMVSSGLCADGTYNGGPTFSDDAGCGVATPVTPYTAPAI